MTAFFDRVSYPVFTDLRLTMPGAKSFDVYPRDLVISIAASSCSSWAGIAATGPGCRARGRFGGRPPHVR